MGLLYIAYGADDAAIMLCVLSIIDTKGKAAGAYVPTAFPVSKYDLRFLHFLCFFLFFFSSLPYQEPPKQEQSEKTAEDNDYPPPWECAALRPPC